MRGHLKSKFIVLSDDRVLPPYQGNKGKRSRPGDDDPGHASGKRQHQANYSQQSAQAVAGVSAIQYAPGLVYPGQIPQVNFIIYLKLLKLKEYLKFFIQLLQSGLILKIMQNIINIM